MILDYEVAFLRTAQVICHLTPQLPRHHRDHSLQSFVKSAAASVVTFSAGKSEVAVMVASLMIVVVQIYNQGQKAGLTQFGLTEDTCQPKSLDDLGPTYLRSTNPFPSSATRHNTATHCFLAFVSAVTTTAEHRLMKHCSATSLMESHISAGTKVAEDASRQPYVDA